MIAAEVHTVEMVPRTRRYGGSRLPVVEWRGECTCGARSEWLPAAGMVHGWEADHQEGER